MSLPPLPPRKRECVARARAASLDEVPQDFRLNRRDSYSMENASGDSNEISPRIVHKLSTESSPGQRQRSVSFDDSITVYHYKQERFSPSAGLGIWSSLLPNRL